MSARQLSYKAAFPRPLSHDETPSGTTNGDRLEYVSAQDGMTLREYFAGLAMQAAAGRQDAVAASVQEIPALMEVIARQAVALADALIAELAKPAP